MTPEEHARALRVMIFHCRTSGVDAHAAEDAAEFLDAMIEELSAWPTHRRYVTSWEETT